jgi:hypothetical protein
MIPIMTDTTDDGIVSNANIAEDTTPTSSSGVENDATIAQDTSSHQAPQEEDRGVQNVNGEQTQRNYQAEAGKMSALEKERNELKKQAEFLAQIDSVFAKDPTAYEAFRQSYSRNTGVDLGNYAELYPTEGFQNTSPSQEQYSSGQGQNSQGQYGGAATPQGRVYTPEEIRNISIQAVEDKQGVEKLIQDYPELDPKSPENREYLEKVWGDVSTVASAIMATRPGMTSYEALKTAYETLPEVRQKVATKQAETAKLQGKQEALTIGSASGGTPQGSSGGAISPETIQMNEHERERYNSLKSNNPRVAEIYLKNLQKKKN